MLHRLHHSFDSPQELEKLATQGANGHAPKAATSLPVVADAPRDAPRSALDVLARESAAYVKKIESLEGSAAQLITRLRLQEEEEAEVRTCTQRISLYIHRIRCVGAPC